MIRILPPILAALALAGPAAADAIDGMLGRWAGFDLDACAAADNSEAAPLRIARESDGTAIGDYGWQCLVKSWRPEGAFVSGEGDCAAEGGGDEFRTRFQLGLTDVDQLVMARDGHIAVLRRCPPAR